MATKKAYRPKKTPQERMAELAKKRGKNGKPLWDLDRDGITYTMLSRFMVCRERFRLSAVEGWSETGLQAALEFGSAFHRCLENPKSSPEKITRQYQAERVASKALFRNQLQEFETLMGIVEAVVHGYRSIYSDDDAKTKTTVFHEEKFDIQYALSLPVNYREVRLRGRFDHVFRDKLGKLWLLETKTKSDIDDDGISRTLSQDLQTMLYVSALEKMTGEKVAGVVYNVIRRPALRQKKSESIRQFVLRVKQTVLEQADKYFLRWTHTLDKHDLSKWQARTLDPLLRQVCSWWDSIKKHPFDPEYLYRPGSEHYQRPFGVYDSLASGRRGDFFELLTGGSTSGLKRREVAFPELAD